MMDLASCSKCRKSISTEVREQLAGLCLECLRRFVREKDEEILPSGGGDAPPSDEILPLEIGSTFQGLQVLELVARGGMGVVYKARQPDLNRIVALKVLSPKLAKDPEFAQRFNGEAKVLALLAHPNIVRVFDFGRESELYYLVMEYVEGSSLRPLLQKGPLSGDLALRILSQACTALDYAHRRGIVHRDIKPENILIDAEGWVKIADFGLAKIMPGTGASETRTETGVLMGTPRYMAPEQSDNPKSVDPRTDIYALGVVLYEMLTGHPPIGHFPAPSLRFNVDRRLDRIVSKAIEASPERRYQRASELKTDLDTVSSSMKGRVSRSPKKRALLLLSIALVVFAGGAFPLWKSRQKASALSKASVESPHKVWPWQWENPAPGSRTEGDELIFTPGTNQGLSEAAPVSSILGHKFHLHFKYRYQIAPKQEPWLFLVMQAAENSGHERNALVLFPESDHTIHFASRVPGKGWGLRDWQSLPASAHGSEQWFDVDVYWIDLTKRIKVSINSTEVFNAQLGARDTLHGVWSFGLGGSAKELRIRDVWILNEP